MGDLANMLGSITDLAPVVPIQVPPGAEFDPTAILAELGLSDELGLQKQITNLASILVTDPQQQQALARIGRQLDALPSVIQQIGPDREQIGAFLRMTRKQLQPVLPPLVVVPDVSDIEAGFRRRLRSL